jgi:hypothetical protein
MRIAIVDFKNLITEKEKQSLLDKISPEYRDCIFFDIFEEDIEEAEYCLDIRMYDAIFVNYRSEHSRKYYNLLGILSRYYELDYKFYMFQNNSEDKNFDTFQARAKEAYKNVEINYLGSFYEKEALTNQIINLTENLFITIPIVKNVEINHEEKIVNVTTEDGIVSLEIKKEIDFQILLYFMRHYGEVININSILSAITDEPEFMNNSPIESSISSIRKIFKLSLGTNPIKAFKRVGYKFQM